MRRLIYLLLLVTFVATSATCVNASTDCERWFIAYRREVAHSRNMQRIAAAKRRAKLYAQHKISLVQPKPRVVLAKAPRMTRKETLHHFNLACGVLPDGDVDEPLLAEETPGPFRPNYPHDDKIGTLPADINDLIAQNDVPPPPPTEGPNYSSGGGPPIFYPPYTGPGTSPGGGSPGTRVPPNTPGIPPPPPAAPPVTPPVPEPSTYVLLLTGMVGAAGAIRSRFKA